MGGIIVIREQATERKIHIIRIGWKNTQEGRMHRQDGQTHKNTTPAINIIIIRSRQKGAYKRREEKYHQDRKKHF